MEDPDVEKFTKKYVFPPNGLSFNLKPLQIAFWLMRRRAFSPEPVAVRYSGYFVSEML
ncbi:hypothetical protein D322_2787 [Yersinia enterocolitica IP 10393]|nr:hypothetical protein D322_2787 [Yersinia enterocolitica IP 10393]